VKNFAEAPERIDLAERFGRLAQRPGGRPRKVAIERAQAELVRLKPELSPVIVTGCRDLESALSALSQSNHDSDRYVEQAYAASQNLRDVAGSLGFSLVGFIASNLCVIFEIVSAAGIRYPLDVISCHLEALHLAQAYLYRDKMPADLQALTKGLSRTVQRVKNAAVSAATGGSEPG